MTPFVSQTTRLATVAGSLALAALAALHVLSPEFDPSWRMISEYANGQHHWAITLFFAAWATSSFALAAALFASGGSWVTRVGAVFLALSGVGEAMGAAFDVNHPGHGAAFGLGVPTLPVAALFAGLSLARRDKAPVLTWLSQAPWLSVVLMAGSFALCLSTANAVGLELSPDKPWTEVPAGVTAVMGWANRLLVVAYVAWTLVVARHLRTREGARPAPSTGE